jgi:transcriptional regulator with XRE-family HTH domain
LCYHCRMASVEKALKSISRSELARQSETSPGFISMLLQGERDAKVSTLRRIAAALGVSIDALDAYLMGVKSKSEKSSRYGWKPREESSSRSGQNRSDTVVAA